MELASPTDAAQTKPALPYRISVDVRQRHGQIQLKSLNATPWNGTDGKLHFQSHFPGGWMAGQLDENTGASGAWTLPARLKPPEPWVTTPAWPLRPRFGRGARTYPPPDLGWVAWWFSR
jgi:hypothetical protein